MRSSPAPGRATILIGALYSSGPSARDRPNGSRPSGPGRQVHGDERQVRWPSVLVGMGHAWGDRDNGLGLHVEGFLPDGCPPLSQRPTRISTPAAIARRASRTPGMGMLTSRATPVTTSQIPSKSIPRFFVSFMVHLFAKPTLPESSDLNRILRL